MRLLYWLLDNHPLGTFLWSTVLIVAMAVTFAVGSHLCWCG